MNQIQINMEKVLYFIIEYVRTNNIELEDYPSLLEPLKVNFDIRDYCGQKATKELLDTVIWWENHPEIQDSLEKTLNDKFFIPKM